MTPTEIRTALEKAHDILHETYDGTDCRAVDALKILAAILSALPGETAPLPCPECRETDRVWAVGDGRYRCAACDVGYTLADVKPAPPRALVEVVRGYQRADASVRRLITEGDDRMADVWRDIRSEKHAAILAYPLPAPEAPETPR